LSSIQAVSEWETKKSNNAELNRINDGTVEKRNQMVPGSIIEEKNKLKIVAEGNNIQ
jgi:hypothetical protein